MNALHLEPTRYWLLLRRIGFATMVGFTIAVISWRAFLMLRINGLSTLKLTCFVLFVILLVPITLSFWTAVIGFIVQWRGGDSLDLTRTRSPSTAGLNDLPRTAIVMPVYNEDPVRVFAGLKATY